MPNVFYLFICLWLHWVFVVVPGLSLVGVRRGYSLFCAGASHCSGFSSCGTGAPGTQTSVVGAHGQSSCGTQA